MDKWLTLNEMAIKYDLTECSLGQFSYNNKGSEYIKKADSRVFYNETLLLKKQKEHRDIWNACHEYYFYLTIDVSLKHLDIARFLFKSIGRGSVASWSSFFSHGLFCPIHENSILSVNKKKHLLLAFCIWCEENIPKIEKRLNTKRAAPC